MSDWESKFREAAARVEELEQIMRRPGDHLPTLAWHQGAMHRERSKGAGREVNLQWRITELEEQLAKALAPPPPKYLVTLVAGGTFGEDSAKIIADYLSEELQGKPNFHALLLDSELGPVRVERLIEPDKELGLMLYQTKRRVDGGGLKDGDPVLPERPWCASIHLHADQAIARWEAGNVERGRLQDHIDAYIEAMLRFGPDADVVPTSDNGGEIVDYAGGMGPQVLAAGETWVEAFAKAPEASTCMRIIKAGG